ncbi:MAG: type II toxin-antitoxin system PemK/MazF family toxin [Acidimicrobiia bacterium]
MGAGRRETGRGIHQVSARPPAPPCLRATRRRVGTRVVARNEIYWANLGDHGGRRPVCILTRGSVIAALDRVTCAPITRAVRGIPSEVEVGPNNGLPEKAVINCDNIITIGKQRLDQRPVGSLDEVARAQLDHALRFALDIIY